MNNYPNFKNYMNSNMDIKSMNKKNYINASNPIAYGLEQTINENMYNNATNNYVNQDTTKLYDTYNGFIRGNLFKNLYDPYKLQEPYEIKPMNEQAELLTYIDSLSFAMKDLNLYLDVFPNEKNAINLFNQYRKEKENMLKEYENKFGPITLNSDSLNSYPWAWDDMPWPWDN